MLANNANVGPKVGNSMALKSPANIFPRWRGWTTATTENVEHGNCSAINCRGGRGDDVWIGHILETRTKVFDIWSIQKVAARHIEMVPENDKSAN